ncbi:GNAT family N-acetyltransferase [Legionella sainthelensi]|uniref:GNAT family N-acetyltransferase n=1 Tax=Legionella sainthelensi TaxID=28087 RepID=A0A2H5FLI6_9GAMM|nr:GNAT family N-acetyltransferase [Legionella sainthelensi]AUH72401.1 GNAT family N-acetyltransferase [Legionella sainthelensi]
MVMFHEFHQAEHHFFSLISDAQADYGQMIAFATGVPTSHLNPVMVKKIDEQFLNTLFQCHSFYTSKQLLWSLILPAYLYQPELEKSLQSLHFMYTEKGVAMEALIDSMVFPKFESSLVIREMVGDLSAWSLPLRYGFESTIEITGAYRRKHEIASATGARLYHFSGFIENEPVCSLSLSLYGHYARIDDLATMPVYQKKGYATQLIHAAIDFAKKHHITKCFLEASMTGLSIYQRIGFKELFINRYYEQTPLQLETPRMILRLMNETDLEHLAELNMDEEVRKFFPDGVQTREQTQRRIQEFMAFYRNHGLPCFVIWNKLTHEFMGRCGFGPLEKGEIEVGYLLARKFWGKGYASEALNALLDWSKHHIDSEYIIAFAPIEHKASQRVMEKCNMTYYKVDLGHGVMCKFYRINNK